MSVTRNHAQWIVGCIAKDRAHQRHLLIDFGQQLEARQCTVDGQRLGFGNHARRWRQHRRELARPALQLMADELTTVIARLDSNPHE
jgi:hypothetical protein